MISEIYFVHTPSVQLLILMSLNHLQDMNPFPPSPMDSLSSQYPYYSHAYIFLSSLSSYARAVPEYIAGLSRPPVNV